MSRVDISDVRGAVEDLKVRLLADEAIIYGDIPVDGVRFVGPRPESWRNPELRLLARTVTGLALGLNPDFYLKSLIDGREIDNGDELEELAEELENELAEVREIVEFRQRSLVAPMAPLKFEVVRVEGHSAADVRFERDTESGSLIFLGAGDRNAGSLTMRLFAADVKYLIEQLGNILESIEDTQTEGEAK